MLTIAGYRCNNIRSQSVKRMVEAWCLKRVPYSEVLLCNHRQPVTNGRCSGECAFVITETLNDFTEEDAKAEGFQNLKEYKKNGKK